MVTLKRGISKLRTSILTSNSGTSNPTSMIWLLEIYWAKVVYLKDFFFFEQHFKDQDCEAREIHKDF